MKTWFGHYASSPHEEPVEATVLVYDKSIAIGFRSPDGSNHTAGWDIRDAEAIFDHSLQATRVTSIKVPGSRLFIDGKAALEYIHQLQAEQNKPWHKKEKTKLQGRYLFIFSCLVGILVALYFLIVPWLSEKLVSTVSVKTEEQLGSSVFDALALTAQEDKHATIVLNEFFKELKVTTAYNIHITVVNSEIVNAFALPGGNIVVYSALLKQVKTYPELAALLSHEFTHVNNKHSTKSIFRQLGSRIFLSLLFGKFGSVTSVMIDQADRFKSLTYSRRLEKEADMDGLVILKERKIDPEGFAALFRHLKSGAPASVAPEFLNSHPDIDKRVE
jgi:beta-barrel assembly-enhancing protease